MVSRSLDPFHEFTLLNETFNRFFDSMAGSQQWTNDSFPLDVKETEDGYWVEASLPGLHPDDLDVTFTNNMLTIQGEARQVQEDKSSRYHLKERWSGPFRRSLVLPEIIDAGHIQANYEAGVLSLFLPKREEARPKRIEIQSEAGQVHIQTGPEPKQIEEKAAVA